MPDVGGGVFIQRGLPKPAPAARFVGRGEGAEFFLRDKDGYIAVFAGPRTREPVRVTDIETARLRSADKLLLRDGIPAADSGELLHLLEDLGS